MFQNYSVCLYYNLNELDPKKAVQLFENGNDNDEYDALVDYGVSNDIIIKITENKISYKDIITDKYDHSIFDDYEALVLDEFSILMK